MKRPTTAVALAAASVVRQEDEDAGRLGSSESIAPEDTIQDLLEEHISARKLMRITGTDDLTRLKTLVLEHIDATKVSGLDFGSYVPGLTTLRFKASHLPKIRLLGTSFNQLVSLHLRACGVRELDGIASFTALRELDIAENDIVDIVPLSRLESLESLDLSGNKIVESDQVEYLALLPALKTLSIDRNPIKSEHPQWLSYVQRLLPSLTYIDGKEAVPIVEIKEKVALTPQPPSPPYLEQADTPPVPAPPQSARTRSIRRPQGRGRGAPEESAESSDDPSTRIGDGQTLKETISLVPAPPSFIKASEEASSERTRVPRPPTRGASPTKMPMDMLSQKEHAVRERSAGSDRIPEAKRPVTRARASYQETVVVSTPERPDANYTTRPVTRGGLSYDRSTVPQWAPNETTDRMRPTTAFTDGSHAEERLTSDELALLTDYRPKLTVVRAIGAAEIADANRRAAGGRLTRESSPIAPTLRTSEEKISQ